MMKIVSIRSVKRAYSFLHIILYKFKQLYNQKYNSVTLKLIPDEDTITWKTERLFSGGYVHIKIPRAIGITSGGEFSAYHPESHVLKIENCSQFVASDVIRVGDKALFYKVKRHQSNKEIFGDADLLEYTADSVTVDAGSKEIHVGAAFSLLGVNSSHWAHFLVEYLPKLLYCRTELESVGRLVIEKTIDEHVHALIHEVLPQNVEIIEVEKKTRCIFEKMLYCMPVAYLCNHAEYSILNDTVIPESTRTILRSTLVSVADKINSQSDNYKLHRNIYIAFQGGRGPVNAAEIEGFFRGIGYLVVHPHKICFEEKVRIFSNAKNVVGVGSSGFANILFNGGSVKVLMFMNYERQFDTYFSQLTTEYPEHQICYLIGRRVGIWGINSTYYLGVDEIKNAMREMNF